MLVLWTVLAAVLLAALVVVVATARRHPLADPTALALSPVVALAVLLSADLVPVAVATLALWAWSRGRVVLAGALAAVAVLGGWPALPVLLALVVVPAPGVVGAGRRLLASAGVTLLLVVGPVAALDLGLLLRPVQAWWSGGAGPGSPWFVATLAHHPLGGPSVAVLSLLGAALAAALVVVVGRRRPRPPVADVALVGVVVLVATGPAALPGTALWLVPLVALAGVPWRDHLLWAGAEVVHAVALFGWLGAASDPGHGLPAGWYATVLGLRLVALGRLAWVVWDRAAWGLGPRPPAASWEMRGAAATLDRLPAGRPVDESTGAGAAPHTLLSRRDRDRSRPKEAG